MTNHMNDGERKGMDNQSRGGRGRRGQSTRDAGQEYLDAQRETLIPEIIWLMEQVNDASIALPQRFELASRAMAKLTGIFLSEALAPVADAKRSVILSRLSIHLKATIDTLSRKKEVESSSPKRLASAGSLTLSITMSNRTGAKPKSGAAEPRLYPVSMRR